MKNTKPIPGFPGYSAGVDGSIWSNWNFKGAGYGGKCSFVIGPMTKKLKPSPRKEDGRKRYTLRDKDGKYVRKYGSYFVLIAFVGPKPEGMECCHENGDCTDDSPSNLRWGTAESNKADMIRHGTRVRGEAINTAKLTESDVREIRRSGYPASPHAERLGVSVALVCMVLKGRIWKHVK